MKSVICSVSLITAAMLYASCRGFADETTADRPTLRGICFGPYRASESPDCGVYPTLEEIREELQFIKDAKIAKKIRTYSCLNTLSNVPAICQELGLECWPGAWLGTDPCANEREIEALIAVGKMHLTNCPALIVGNEVLLRRDNGNTNELSETELIENFKRVRRDTGRHIAYAEISGNICAHKDVGKAVDVILVHLYPYWGSKHINEAMDNISNELRKVAVTNYPDKKVIIGETGWPSSGEIQGGIAKPSPENQAKYLQDFLKLSQDNDIDYFYFSLFNESWKTNSGEGMQGGHWGLFTEDGKLNPFLKTNFFVTAQSGMNRQPGAIPKPHRLDLPAYIYADACSESNRFFPTFYMGDASSDLAIDNRCTTSPHSGTDCIKITYNLTNPKRTNLSALTLNSNQRFADDWAGIYWIGPYINHTGKYPGYIVHGAKRVEFWARGEEGGEMVEFTTGGINFTNLAPDVFRDSFDVRPSPENRLIHLSKKWKKYTISLAGADTSSYFGGFCVAVSEAKNPGGCAFYLDDILITR